MKKKNISIPKQPKLPKESPPQMEEDTNITRDIIFPFIGSLIVVILLGFVIIRINNPFQRFISDIKTIIFPNKRTVLKAPFSNTMVRDLLQYQAYMMVDPDTVISRIDRNDNSLVLVDIRDMIAYRKGHIRGAISIPVITSVSKLSGEEKNNLITEFKKLKSTDIVLYADTRYSERVFEMASFLFEQNIHVRILAVGWTEFRFFSNFWLPERKWKDFSINSYIEPRIE